MSIQEYDKFYTENPKKWANVKHDEMIFRILRSYDRPDTFLDVGCGNGHLIEYLQPRRFNTEFTGLDFSPVAVELAKKNAPNARFVCSDIKEFSADEQFDMITCVGVAEHFIEPGFGLAKTKMLLKPNGIMYLEVPNCLAYRSNKSNEQGYRRIEQGSRQLEWHLTRVAWEELIRAAGFEVLETITGPNLTNEFIWILAHE